MVGVVLLCMRVCVRGVQVEMVCVCGVRAAVVCCVERCPAEASEWAMASAGSACSRRCPTTPLLHTALRVSVSHTQRSAQRCG